MERRGRSGASPPVALSIAGSDSGGGAGIQADLRTFASLGVHGATAVTAVTAQNTAGVQAVHPVPADFVRAQISAVLTDLPVAAVKTGMLGTQETVAVVAASAEAGELPNLVVDPVMVASTGEPLLDPDARRAYAELLLPRARVATPNLWEASLLLGRELAGVEDMETAARDIHDLGCASVVVKGGHLAGPGSPDVLFDGERVSVLTGARIATANDHGTGCTLSAAIAAHLAAGAAVGEAVARAKVFVAAAIAGAAGWSIGAGHGPLDQMAGARNAPLSPGRRHPDPAAGLGHRGPAAASGAPAAHELRAIE